MKDCMHLQDSLCADEASTFSSGHYRFSGMSHFLLWRKDSEPCSSSCTVGGDASSFKWLNMLKSPQTLPVWTATALDPLYDLL